MVYPLPTIHLQHLLPRHQILQSILDNYLPLIFICRARSGREEAERAQESAERERAEAEAAEAVAAREAAEAEAAIAAAETARRGGGGAAGA